MLLFLSDLHLSESSNPHAIRIPNLLRCLDTAAQQAHSERVQQLNIVLLGDIFEMLKTERWLNTTKRPWDKGVECERITLDIFRGIANANAAFFEGLASLAHKYQSLVRYHYIPGNHDYLMENLSAK